ncbi:MAG: zinc-ribbon domain-containing protein, partial [Phascolarctobacterium sp.]|nr:zinc-ribbon domain-containing protein [Phascolarctobacterium sp.]
MFCIHCGKKLIEGAKFCAFCGGKVAQIVENVSAYDLNEKKDLEHDLVSVVSLIATGKERNQKLD